VVSWGWSLPLGRFLGVELRLHWILLLWAALDIVAAAFAEATTVGRAGVRLGALFLAAILHEAAHCAVSRGLGGDPERVFLWPLGGLAEAPSPPHPRARVLIALAGPAANLVAALLLIYPVLSTGQVNSVLLSIGAAEGDPDLLATLFGAHLDLLLFNLLPAAPLDGGRVLFTLLAPRLGEEAARERLVLASRITAVALAAVALLAPLPGEGRGALLAVALVIIAAAHRVRHAAPEGEGAEGWRAPVHRRRESRPARWLREKRERSAARERESAARERVAEESRVDDLLEKVHRSGEESLTREERRFLERASRRFRSK